MEATEAVSATTEVPTQTEDAANESADTQGEGSQSGEGQKASKDQKGAATKQARELGEQDFDSIVTVKIGGETKKLPLREVIKLNQLENVSRAKAEEASKLIKQVQGVINKAKSDPRSFLKDTGIDPYEFAEATLAEKFEMMNLSPEQKELMETKNRLKSYEEKEKADREASEREELTQAEAKETETLDKEIGEALREPGLPKTRKTVADIAFKMLSASKQGKTLTAKEAAASIKQEFITSTQELFAQMDAEAIHAALGKDVLKKIREFDVKRVTGKAASQNSQGLGAKPISQTKQEFRSEHEWREHIAKMASNLTD